MLRLLPTDDVDYATLLSQIFRRPRNKTFASDAHLFHCEQGSTKRQSKDNHKSVRTKLVRMSSREHLSTNSRRNQESKKSRRERGAVEDVCKL